MTQEQDIVERLQKAGTYWQTDKGSVFHPNDLCREAAQTIAALRAERDGLESRITAYKKDIISLGRECGKEWERAEAAEAKIKELEAVVSSLRQDLKRSAEAGMRVMDQRTTAIRERDEARKALAPFATEAAKWPSDVSDDYKIACCSEITVGDLRRARDASSNREGGE